MKFIKKFATESAYNDYMSGSTIYLPNVSLVDATNEVFYNPYDYSRDYFTFVALDDCVFTFSPSDGSVSYSTDGGTTWSEASGHAVTPTITAGNKVLWKGEIDNSQVLYGGTIDSTGRYDVEGNIMSILYGDNFMGQTSLDANSYELLKYLFGCEGPGVGGPGENDKIIHAHNLILPATTLAPDCYSGMFSYCTNLVTTPAILPATTLVEGCYRNMFQNCTNLISAPELPAMTLAEDCYYNMFYGCSSLTTAPELPATTLAENCYYQMFGNCSNLVFGPTRLPATTLATNCYGYMFYGCTNLTTAPELPASTLVNSCYYGMFNGCSSLNYIKCLATNISASQCLYGWVTNVAANGTFIKNSSMSSWTTGTSGIPSGWTTQNA